MAACNPCPFLRRGRTGRTSRTRQILLSAIVLATLSCSNGVAAQPSATSNDPFGNATQIAGGDGPQPAVLRLAVAANFRTPFDELAGDFKARHGVSLSPSFGSSGLLAAQIRQGAPFDAFFSADTARPQALIADGLAISPVSIYARGRVALRRSAGAGSGGDLLSRRIGIPNPQLAPYGTAALQCLNRLGVAGQVEERLVFGNNVNQVDHFLESGALRLGFVALSQLVARQAPPEEYWICPTAFHEPIAQGAVILHRSRHPAAALALLHYITRPATQAKLAQLGYLANE